MKYVILNLVILTILIYFHTDISRLCIDLKLSFTLAQLMPYTLEFCAIVALIFNVNMQFLKERSHNMKRFSTILILAIGCGTAFAIHPIYEGDFNNTYQEVYFAGESEGVFKKGINMVSKPGCPYCYMRLEELNKMKELYPTLHVNILVINNDTLALEDYRETANKDFTVGFFPNELLTILHIEAFPTLFYKPEKEAKNIVKWSNNGFGSSAWDYVLERENN